MRQIARGIWTTAVDGQAIKGESIHLEKHEHAPRQPRPFPDQQHSWTFLICGGETDGRAHRSRWDAYSAAVLYREGA